MLGTLQTAPSTARVSPCTYKPVRARAGKRMPLRFPDVPLHVYVLALRWYGDGDGDGTRVTVGLIAKFI
jgi:hypothetical protein